MIWHRLLWTLGIRSDPWPAWYRRCYDGKCVTRLGVYDSIRQGYNTCDNSHVICPDCWREILEERETRKKLEMEAARRKRCLNYFPGIHHPNSNFNYEWIK